MSDKHLKLISNFAGLAMLLFGAVAAFDWLGQIQPLGGVSLTQIFAGLATLAGVLSRWAAGQLPPPEVQALPRVPPGAAAGVVAVLALIAALVMPACGNLAPGYRAVTVTVKVGNETGKTLASACRVKRMSCLDKHAADKQALKACLKPCHKALTAWTTIARPAVNTATEATFAALETARQAKRSASTWIAKLRPGACALVRSLLEWRTLLGDKAKPLLDLLNTVKEVACGD